ncbi:MAG TPA: tripartite tricarboxylate transporter substrate binding protein [Myxococcaceae bacterium]|nr:tripartite tricarboxylate transporter substrate binding protein [Myxococcaceae bacterium]
MQKLIRVFALGLLVWSPVSLAQAYPTKPIHMIVPYVAGGAADITARVLGQKLSESLGVPVLVENRGGANGMIGTKEVAKAAPDGYTLLLVASGPIVVNPSLYPNMPYDPVKDLQPISQVATYQYVLVVPSSSPITSVKDLVAQAKAKPGKLSYGSTGIGGGNHLAGELFAAMTGTELTHIPYKGSAAALADLLGGQISFMFDTVVTSVPHLRAQKLRAFAVTGRKRASVLPEVPTLDELGYKGFEMTQWQGFFAPARTDRAIVARLHQEIIKALKQPDVVERLVKEGGNEIVGSSPEEFAKVIESDLGRYARLIKDRGIKVE